MRSNDLITPEGTKDLLFEECIIRQLIEDKIHKIFNSMGYSELIPHNDPVPLMIPLSLKFHQPFRNCPCSFHRIQGLSLFPHDQ